MTDRQFEAVRQMVNIMRSDVTTMARVMKLMGERGFTAKEIQDAVNEISARTVV